jgi:TRAP-type C4-dicarboxylate transport system permease small subunit
VARIVEAYFHLLKFLIAAFLAVMVVLVFGNVFLRYAFNTGITSSEELSRLLFVWLTFLGAIVALREHGHLGVDVLVKRLPTGGKKLCLVLGHLLMLYATWLFLTGSWQQTLINLEVASPATGFSMGLLYAPGVVFSISAGLILLHDLYRMLTGRLGEAELVMVRESEDEELLEELHPGAASSSAPGAAPVSVAAPPSSR